MKWCYMAVKDDALELPCIVGTSKEVAKFVGMSIGSFYCALERKTKSHTGYRVYKVRLEE